MDPKECVRQRTVEQIGNVPVLQFLKQVAEIIRKRISCCVSFDNVSNEVFFKFCVRRPLASLSTTAVILPPT